MKIHILIVDDVGRDDLAILKLYQWIERDSETIVNLSTSTDFDPEEIMVIRPDLVILDVALDGEDEYKLRDVKNQDYIPKKEFYSRLSGIMFCHQLKSNFSNIPVVIITNHFMPGILSAAFEAGADGFLYKEEIRRDATMSSLKSIVYKSRTEDFVLYQALRVLLDNLGDSAWKCKHMLRALNAFFSRGSSPRRIFSLWRELAELIENIMPSQVVRNLINAQIDAEALLIAASPNMREHVRHTGNVFWIGYYLINSLDFFRQPENLKYIVGTSCKGDSRTSWDRLNLMWILSSLLHDIGYLREGLPIVEDKFKRIQDLLWVTSKKRRSRKQNDVPEPLEPIFDELKAMEGIDADQLREALNSAVNRWKTGGGEDIFRDHGIVGAAAVLRQLERSGGDKMSRELTHVALSIAFHNLPKWNKWLSPPARLPIRSFPIAWLLSYCDELQGWGRVPDGSVLIASREEIVGDPKESVGKAYIEGSRICEFSSVPDKKTILNTQLSIGVQYIIAHGENTEGLSKSLRTDISEWRREVAPRVRDTLQLDGLIAARILHRVPAPVPEPIEVFLDERGGT